MRYLKSSFEISATFILTSIEASLRTVTSVAIIAFKGEILKNEPNKAKTMCVFRLQNYQVPGPVCQGEQVLSTHTNFASGEVIFVTVIFVTVCERASLSVCSITRIS